MIRPAFQPDRCKDQLGVRWLEVKPALDRLAWRALCSRLNAAAAAGDRDDGHDGERQGFNVCLYERLTRHDAGIRMTVVNFVTMLRGLPGLTRSPRSGGYHTPQRLSEKGR